MLNQGYIAFGGGGVKSINGAPGPSITFAGVSGIFVERDGNTIFIGMSGGDGPRIRNVVSVVNDYSPTNKDDVVLSSAAAGQIVITMPPASDPGVSGHEFNIKKTDSSANQVIVSGAQNIEGALTAPLTIQYEAITIISDNSQYWII